MEPILKEQEEKLKTLHDETHTRMQEVLTKEQVTKMDAMKKQRYEKWQKKYEALKNKKASEQMR